AMYLIAMVVFHRLISLIAPDLPVANALVTLLLGGSLITVPATLWWSNGASNFPSMIFTLLSIDCGWRYLSSRRPRHALGAVVSFTLGLGFFESVFIVLV